MVAISNSLYAGVPKFVGVDMPYEKPAVLSRKATVIANSQEELALRLAEVSLKVLKDGGLPYVLRSPIGRDPEYKLAVGTYDSLVLEVVLIDGLDDGFIVVKARDEKGRVQEVDELVAKANVFARGDVPQDAALEVFSGTFYDLAKDMYALELRQSMELASLRLQSSGIEVLDKFNQLPPRRNLINSFSLERLRNGEVPLGDCPVENKNFCAVIGREKVPVFEI